MSNLFGKKSVWIVGVLVIGLVLFVAYAASLRSRSGTGGGAEELPDYELLQATQADTSATSVIPPYQDPREDPRVTMAREQCVDLNGDGDCDSGDTLLLKNAIGACKGEANYSELMDVDHDGCVTTDDQEQLFPMFVRDSSYELCDLDLDGDCDRDDYEILLRSVHMCFEHKPNIALAYNPLADADRDGCVLRDLVILFPVIPERETQ